MIHATNPDDDLAAEGGSRRRVQLVDELRLIHKPTPQLYRADDAVMRAIHAGPQTAPALPQPHRRRHLRLGVPLAAIVAVVLGLGALVQQQTPATVSAQTILHRAAKAGLTPNQVTHFVYQITSSTGYAGTTEFWVQADDSAAAERVAFAEMGEQGVVIGRHLAAAYDVYLMRDLPPSFAGSQVLGKQTLDGVAVDVVQNPAGVTLYFDAQSYILRAVEWTEKEGTDAGSTWKARLQLNETVPVSSVPTGSWHTDPTPEPTSATGTP